MPDFSDKVLQNLPYLRRYARALMGSQDLGDTYVRISLETLLQEPARHLDSNPRLGLFRLFHQVLAHTIGGGDGRIHASDDKEGGSTSQAFDARLQALPAQERQILILTSLEGFSIEDAAAVIGIERDEASNLLASAWESVNAQISTSILIIEDEPVIAIDLAGLIRDMGHALAGVAATQTEAIQLARKTRPGLILADIDLGPGGSGLTAVQAILQSASVPVIFVTAYPERLLTGERPEPTYLVTKPFQPDTLKVAISQALSFHQRDSGRSPAA